MNTDSLDEQMRKLIATYLEGLHNPNEDGLYNELRAMRDTENLKQGFKSLLASQLKSLLNELPKEKAIVLDVPLDAEDDDNKFCVECGHWAYEGEIDCKCVGFNEALKSVRTIINKHLKGLEDGCN